MSTDWIPKLPGDETPRYLAIVDALEDAVRDGTMPAGTRLPPQRDMAEKLGLSVGTVLKAYLEAGRRGLIAGKAGRGTFVRSASAHRFSPAIDRERPIFNLSLNAPPPVDDASLVAEALKQIADDEDLPSLLGYLPHPGLPAHRKVTAQWLRQQNIDASADRLILCNGARQAISVALSVTAQPGDIILTEEITYPGLEPLADAGRYRLHGVAMDEFGLRPDALDNAFAVTGAKTLFCVPTLHTPLGVTMPLSRRTEIAEIIRKHKAVILEDDVYTFLHPSPPPSFFSLVPDQVFHLTSFAKSAAGGLRIGVLLLPSWAQQRTALVFRHSSWMAAPIMAALAVRLILEGSLDELIVRRRKEARLRWAIAREVLGPRNVPDSDPSYQLWLTPNIPIADLVSAAALHGVILAPTSPIPGSPPSQGIRICIGAPKKREDLRAALQVIAMALEQRAKYAVI
jgi:DNA-binding transcriptional MocR family regulator